MNNRHPGRYTLDVEATKRRPKVEKRIGKGRETKLSAACKKNLHSARYSLTCECLCEHGGGKTR